MSRWFFDTTRRKMREKKCDDNVKMGRILLKGQHFPYNFSSEAVVLTWIYFEIFKKHDGYDEDPKLCTAGNPMLSKSTIPLYCRPPQFF